MHKLFFALLLLGASTWGLSQLLSDADHTTTQQTTPQIEPRCEVESVSLRPGEVIDLPSGNYLSFQLRAPIRGEWLPIDFQVQSPDGEVIANFSQLIREGSTITLGSFVVGPDPVSVHCSL
jgi:hypothetical protein